MRTETRKVDYGKDGSKIKEVSYECGTVFVLKQFGMAYTGEFFYKCKIGTTASNG